jgi:hypothetical protein
MGLSKKTFIGVIILFFSINVKGQYEDILCKQCVVDYIKSLNITSTPSVYKVSQCYCDYLVEIIEYPGLNGNCIGPRRISTGEILHFCSNPMFNFSWTQSDIGSQFDVTYETGTCFTIGQCSSNLKDVTCFNGYETDDFIRIEAYPANIYFNYKTCSIDNTCGSAEEIQILSSFDALPDCWISNHMNFDYSSGALSFSTSTSSCNSNYLFKDTFNLGEQVKLYSQIKMNEQPLDFEFNIKVQDPDGVEVINSTGPSISAAPNSCKNYSTSFIPSKTGQYYVQNLVRYSDGSEFNYHEYYFNVINPGPTIPTFTDVTPPNWKDKLACGVQIGDINNDSFHDVLFDGYIMNNSSSGFLSPILKFTDQTGETNEGRLLDFDNDGDLDRNRLSELYINDGNGNFFKDIDLCATHFRKMDINHNGDSEYLTKVNPTYFCFFPTDSCFITGSKLGFQSESTVNNYFDLGNDLEIEILSNNGKLSTINNSEIVSINNEFAFKSNWIEGVDINNDGKTEVLMSDSTNLIITITNNVKSSLNVQANNFSYGDINNDGNIDIIANEILFGKGDGTFIKHEIPNTDFLEYTFLQPLDYDRDGDLDVIIENSNELFPLLYRNNSTIKNTKPNSPNTLNATVTQSDKRVDFTWKNGGDDLTDFPTYNLFVQNLDSKKVIYFPHADSTSGTLTLLEKGNCEYNTGWFLKDLAPGRYRWKVQAIDQGYMGSSWAVGQNFVIDKDRIDTLTLSLVLRSPLATLPNDGIIKFVDVTLDTKGQRLDTLSFLIKFDQSKVKVEGITQNANISDNDFESSFNNQNGVILIKITKTDLNNINGPLVSIAYSPLEPCTNTWQLKDAYAVRYDNESLPSILNSLSFNIKEEIDASLAIKLCRANLLETIKSEWGVNAEFEISLGSSQDIPNGFVVKRLFSTSPINFYDDLGNKLSTALDEGPLVFNTTCHQFTKSCDDLCKDVKIDVDSTTCGLNNGSINILDPNKDFDVKWNGSTTETQDRIFENLTAGTYSMNVSLGTCSRERILTVGSSTSVNAQTTAMNTMCGQANGSISLSGLPGTSTYTYEWSNGSTSSSLALLPAIGGMYAVTITRDDGCSDTITNIEVKGSMPLSITSTVTQPSCDMNNGKIVLPVGFTYKWGSSTVTQNLRENLAPGNYIYTVTDAIGCTTSGNVELNPSSSLNAISIPKRQPTCKDNDDGEVIIEPNSANPLEYKYEWSNSSITDYNPKNLKADTDYIVTVTRRIDNCTSIVTIPKMPKYNPSVAINSPRDLIDCKDPSGIPLTLTIGNKDQYNNTYPITTYQWSTNEQSPSINVIPSASTNYTVIITDSKGCSATANKEIKVDQQKPIVTINSPDGNVVNCYKPSLNLLAQIQPGSPSGGYDYQWNTNSNAPNTTANQPIPYSVIATSQVNGCKDTAQVIITDNRIEPRFDLDFNGTLTCRSPEDTLDIKIDNRELYFYTWEDNQSNILPRKINQKQDYVLTVTNIENGCTARGVFNIEEDKDLPDFNLIIDPEKVTCKKNVGISIEIDTSNYSLKDFKYLWHNGSSADFIIVSDTSSIEVLVTNLFNGCEAGQKIFIEVDQDSIAGAPCGDEPGFYIQDDCSCEKGCKTLTLSDDDQLINVGQNNYLKIELANSFETNVLTIVNRWGQRVFERKGYISDWQNGWRGELFDTGDLVPDGAYYFMIDLLPDQKGCRFSGSVTVVR